MKKALNTKNEPEMWTSFIQFLVNVMIGQFYSWFFSIAIQTLIAIIWMRSTFVQPNTLVIRGRKDLFTKYSKENQ